MIKKISFFCAAAGAGVLFSRCGVPAGWLIGALLTGAVYGLFFKPIRFSGRLFDFALAYIGANIGLLMKTEMTAAVWSHFIPLLVVMVLILMSGWLFGKILYRLAPVDQKTAFFCCVPGGASVMMALSERYGADSRIVAAFHSARITLFVMTIPLLAGWLAQPTVQNARPLLPAGNELYGVDFLIFFIVVGTAFFLALILPIPAAPFLYAMILAFVVNEWFFPIGMMPKVFIGLGQVLLGGMIGLRFDRRVLRDLQDCGLPGAFVLFLYVCMSFFVSFLFFLMTELDFVTSLLSIVPAGAAEMASTAALLHLPASVVASLQLVRLLILFFVLPVLIPFFIKSKTSMPSKKL